MKYAKPALTVEQQIAQLRARGMIFNDPERAAHYLRELNYYRLSGYWLRREADHASHTFVPGTTFEDVLADYVFDRELSYRSGVGDYEPNDMLMLRMLGRY